MIKRLLALATLAAAIGLAACSPAASPTPTFGGGGGLPTPIESPMESGPLGS